MSGEARRRRLRAFLRDVGISPANGALFEGAFVHESAASETGRASNERLEFLGDSILGFLCSAWLYATFPQQREGELSRRKAALVSEEALAVTARRLQFGELLQLGKGLRSAGGADNSAVLADAFEAFLAVLFIEQGLEAARTFLIEQHLTQIDQDDSRLIDVKTALQEYVQKTYSCMPEYREQSTGTLRAPSFSSSVSVRGAVLGTGIGPSKKIAQQIAAAQALRTLQMRT